MPDTQIRVIAARMLACLCTAVNANPDPPLNCCLRIEPDVPEDIDETTDICCEGLAYVTMGDVWPSSASFPENDIVRQANTQCAPPAWGLAFKIGIMRCAPASSDCGVQADAFILDANDVQALQAASCCIRNYIQTDPQWVGMSVVIERQSKTVQGGCANRSVTINIQVPNCQTC